MTKNSYAIALFEIAKEDNALELCYECFKTFMDNYDGDFKLFFTSPKIDVKEKKAIISKAFKNSYEDFIYFINVVIDNHRENLIEEIYDGFIDLYNENMKIKIVKVLSPRALTTEEESVFLKSLTNYFSGYQIIIKNEVDEKIIGGYKIYADGNSIDFSINKALLNLKAQL